MSNFIYLYEILVDTQNHSAQGLWQEVFEKRLDELEYNYERVKNRIRIWNEASSPKKTPRKDVVYRDGIEVFKVSMPRSYEHPVIGFNFARLYFFEGESYPAYQSSAELFKEHKMPDVLRQLPLLDFLDNFISCFNKESDLIRLLDNITWSSVSDSVLVEGVARQSNVKQMSDLQYSKAILGMVRNNKAVRPANFELALIDAFVADENKAREVASTTSAVLEKEWGCKLSKKRISTSEQFEDWLNEPHEMQRVGFFGLDGKKGIRPSQNAIEWMGVMEQAKVPYVLFSATRDVNPIYTRHGNAMHLLAKAGGQHYRTRPVSIPDFDEHWFIGLDLGIGAQYKGKCVVVTLTDASGAPVCYWRAIKDNDETLTEELLREAVSWIINQAEELAPDRKIVVIRDGLCPHHELMSTYKELLPAGRSLFIEYTKKGNPAIIEEGRQPQPGTMAIPDGSSEAFLFTARSPQNDMLTNTTRFRCRINDMKYTLEQVGEMLTALCFSPKLSFQPSSIPAPIYWADGIASVSNTNLQFAGWRHLPNVTRDFRIS